MSYVVTVLLTLAVVVGSLWWLRHRAFEAQVSSLATAIAKLRAMTTQEIRYRRPPAGTEVPPDLAGHFEAASHELAREGFRELGDALEEDAGGTVAGTTRWFADASGTVCGWFSVVAAQPPIPAMMLFSESAAGEFGVTTRGGSTIALVRPPSMHWLALGWESGLAGTLDRHRGLLDPGATLTRVATLEDATGMLARLRAATARWRAAQPPATLLEQDLRQLLGGRYADLGRPLTERMTREGAT